MPRAQIKNEKTYRELRKHGDGKEKSARIANAPAGQGRGKVRPGEAVAGPIKTGPKPAFPAGARDRHQGPVEHDQGPAISALRNH